MKFTKKDIVNLLWQFNRLELEIIDDRVVRKISVGSPNPKNTLLAFQFEGRGYFALFDEEIQPDLRVLTDIVRSVHPNIGELELIGADKFKSKTVYFLLEKVSKWRLDVFLARNGAEVAKEVAGAPELNRSAAQKLVAAGKVEVNGAVAMSNSLMVGFSDRIIVRREGRQIEKLTLPVLYEDADVVVLDKPAGILTHAKGAAAEEPTVADFVRERWRSAAEATNNRLGIVHRLDRGTSGVLIAGRTPEVVKKLQKQFAERKTKKTYFAVVNGVLKQDRANIRLPIARSANRPTTFLVSPEGREAETLYEVIKVSENGRYSLLKLTPKTGRTHQLRVHLSHIGHPIVGDATYGGATPSAHAISGTLDIASLPSVAPPPRLMLHAAELEITLPSGERKVFASKLPPEFEEYVAE